MADDRWLTFDCYGTIADWNTCMREALEPVVGAAAPALLTAYHQAELALEAGPSWRPYREILSSGLRWAAQRLQIPLDAAQAGALVEAWPRMTVFEDAGGALSALASAGWRLAVLTNCDDDLFATTRPKFPVPIDIVVTAEQVRSYKPDLGHFRKFAELTGAAPVNWIHVANSWVHDILPAARMGLRSVWVDRDLTGHPAKLAERRITAMRRLPEAVADVSAVPPWPPLELLVRRGHELHVLARQAVQALADRSRSVRDMPLSVVRLGAAVESTLSSFTGSPSRPLAMTPFTIRSVTVTRWMLS
jgi:2-haloacid dehalogenase